MPAQPAVTVTRPWRRSIHGRAVCTGQILTFSVGASAICPPSAACRECDVNAKNPANTNADPTTATEIFPARLIAVLLFLEELNNPSDRRALNIYFDRVTKAPSLVTRPGQSTCRRSFSLIHPAVKSDIDHTLSATADVDNPHI